MDDIIIVKYIKINGQHCDNPPPRFEYEGQIGVWRIIVEAEHAIGFFVALDGEDVEIEVGMHFGTLRAKGKVSTWQSQLTDAPAFVAKIESNDPMHFVER